MASAEKDAPPQTSSANRSWVTDLEAGKQSARDSGASDGGWDRAAEEQCVMFLEAAQMSTVINELAATFYQRLYITFMLIVTVLTVVVGSTSVASIMDGGDVGDIVSGILQMLLGVMAALMTNLEPRAKSRAYTNRAIAHTKLSAQLRIQLALRPHERVDKMKFFADIPDRVTAIEEMADPLPLRYRQAATPVRAGLSMWSGGYAPHTDAQPRDASVFDVAEGKSTSAPSPVTPSPRTVRLTSASKLIQSMLRGRLV